MTDKQLDAMIQMHRKAEAAYRRFGRVEDAEQACAKAEQLEREREQRKAQQ